MKYLVSIAALALGGLILWANKDQNPIPKKVDNKDISQAPPLSISSVVKTPSSTAPIRQKALSEATETRPVSPRAEILGYGRFIDEAFTSKDARDSFEAAQLAIACSSVDEIVSARYQYIQEKSLAPETRKILLDELARQQDTQRKCQSVSSAQILLQYDLLKQAAIGSVRGAAKQLYMARVFRGETPDEPWMREALVRDAGGGELASLAILACDAVGAGLSSKDRSAYYQTLVWAAEGNAGESNARIAQSKLRHCQPVPVASGGGTDLLRAALRRPNTGVDR